MVVKNSPPAARRQLSARAHADAASAAAAAANAGTRPRSRSSRQSDLMRGQDVHPVGGAAINLDPALLNLALPPANPDPPLVDPALNLADPPQVVGAFPNLGAQPDLSLGLNPDPLADATAAAAAMLAATAPPASQPCLLYTSPSPRDGLLSRMPSSA